MLAKRYETFKHHRSKLEEVKESTLAYVPVQNMKEM